MNPDNQTTPAAIEIQHPSGARIIVARDLDDLSARAAELVVSLAQRAAAVADNRFTVALSGGETPKRLYSLLSTPRYAEAIPWKSVHVCWGDERHVPPGDPESNYHMAQEALLSKVPLPRENVHRIPAELADAGAAARDYADTLRGLFNVQPDGVPRFDLVLLGLGPDGHTASLFPGTDVLHDTEHLVAAPWVDKLNTYRITLTPRVLNNAATIVFLVSGANKAETLYEVLDGPRRPDLYPAQLIAPVHGSPVWILDEAAATQLRGSHAAR